MSRSTPAAIARKAEASRRWFELTPPEGVPVRFEIATLGARLGAQLVDIGLTVFGMIALIIVLAILPFNIEPLVASLAAILALAIRAPYYILTELFWNGQTLGKRMTGLRVLSADGRGLSTHSIVARNLMKEIEVFMPGSLLLAAGGLDAFWRTVLTIWILVVLLIPLFNKRKQRLGDILANTVVARQPRTMLMPDLTEAEAAADAEFVFSAAQLDHYGRFELQTLEDLLRTNPLSADSRARLDESVIRVAAQIRKKIGYEDPVPDDRALAFLHAFYKAQRAYLEQKQIFGDVRDDKHHRENDD